MDLVQAIVLGVIQGLTEFLPVSSSGHLVLFQNLFGLKEAEVLFDIFLHIGTLIAVLIVFFPEIKGIMKTMVQLPMNIRSLEDFKTLYLNNDDVRICVFIIIGSIPTAFLGLYLNQLVDVIFTSVFLVGIMLIVTGTLIWFTRKLVAEGRKLSGMKIKDALVIGFVQGLAIFPGISRSGSTIATSLFLGINRKTAGKFSFLLSIPAILGALFLGFESETIHSTVSPGLIVAGTATSALTGYIALVLLLRLVHRGKLYLFAPYCWIVGILTIILSF